MATGVAADRLVSGRRRGEPRIGLDRTGAPGAPAVLMLHGLGADRRMWSPQAAALRSDHDLLVWDSRGHGRSQWSEPFALESWVEDIDRVLDDQEVARAALIGLSMGGVQAMAYGIARPHRVSVLVLANTWAQLTPEDTRRKLDNLARKAEQIGLEAFAEAYTAGAFADPGSAGARDYRQSLAAMSLPAYVASAEACFGAKLADQIPSIAAPTLVLWATGMTGCPGRCRNSSAITSRTPCWKRCPEPGMCQIWKIRSSSPPPSAPFSPRMVSN